MTDVILEVRSISKQYPGSKKKANNNISFDLHRGEILCIAGENGAGKTTLMKCLCGLEQPDDGEIFINGKKEVISSPITAGKLKIGMVHQHFMLFPEYTVAENIVMGMEPRKLTFFFDTKKAQKIAGNQNWYLLFVVGTAIITMIVCGSVVANRCQTRAKRST